MGVRGRVRWEGKGGKPRTSSRIAEEAVADPFNRQIQPVRYGVERHRNFSSDFGPTKMMEARREAKRHLRARMERHARTGPNLSATAAPGSKYQSQSECDRGSHQRRTQDKKCAASRAHGDKPMPYLKRPRACEPISSIKNEAGRGKILARPDFG